MPTELEVFAEALTILDSGARTEYLDRVCGEDKTQRQRVGELLELHQRSDSVLDRRPGELIESLNDGCQSADAAPDPTITLAALKPYLEPATQPDSLARLSHYELLEILGQGGYGIVFKAFDTKLARMVAMKILLPQLAMTSPPRRRFLREARAAAAVRHENVIQIYAVEESPIPYLVMEFISGETLQQRSDRIGPFDPQDVIRLGQQIARGLSAAHSQRLIHRDIKPGNILIADGIEPVAKLNDFGLAQTADDANRSQSGAIIGTPMYMSPEQISGEEVDQRTDLFSFGSVLYLMATGRPPFRATSTVAVLKRVVESTPRSLRDIIPDAPRGLSAVISRLHSKSRESRYSSAKEVESALLTCLSIPTWNQSVWAFVARKRWLTAVSAPLLLGLACFLICEASGFSTVFNTVPISAEFTQSKAHPETDFVLDAEGARIQVRPIPTVEGSDKKASEQPAETRFAKPVEKTLEISDANVFLSDWDKAVSRMKPDDQVTTVLAKLKQLNPEFDVSSVHFGIEDETIQQVHVEPANNLLDITPIRALRKITRLTIRGGLFTDISALQGLPLTRLDLLGPQINDLTPLKGMPLNSLGIWPFMGDDLSPLRGMKLTSGNLGGGGKLRDLEPLRGMPIEAFCLNHTSVEDLSPLEGMPLKRLEIQNTQVKDLNPIAGLPLEFLGATSTHVTDLSPLKGMSALTEVRIDYDPARDKAVLEAMPGLKTVNGNSIAEFLASP